VASLEVVRAFIASPGDLKEERLAARDVAERVNTYVGYPLGLRIELYGWEIQPPGYGRPQEQINAEVDAAELFVGLLWRRWGTPSSDDHSSGFEEEYDRALKRREAGDHPVLWLFFKDVEEGQLNDPGAELQKVLDFRKGVEARREVLYRTFSDDQDWRTQLHDFLSNFLTKRASETSTSAEPDRSLPASTESAAPQAPGGADSPADVGGDDPALPQLVASIDAARGHLTHEDGPQLPPEFDAARLLLASFTWLSNRRTNEVLDTHEVNVLYRLRDTLEPQPPERLQLVRSLVTGGDVRPGWLWATSFPNTPAAFALGYLARTDQNDEVRAAAVTLLHDARTLANAIPDDLDDDAWEPGPFLRALADDSSDQVRDVAMDLLGREASDDAVDLSKLLALRGARRRVRCGDSSELSYNATHPRRFDSSRRSARSSTTTSPAPSFSTRRISTKPPSMGCATVERPTNASSLFASTPPQGG
jgi:hypothetical protein